MADDKDTAFWLTVVIMSLFGLCFFVNIFVIRLAKNIESYVSNGPSGSFIESEKKISDAI
jgi:hypothetical protein